MRWNDFTVWFATSPIASFLRTALALVVSQAVVDFVKMGHFDFTNAETWVITAFASAIPPLLRWLNPEDKAYGITKLGG